MAGLPISQAKILWRVAPSDTAPPLPKLDRSESFADLQWMLETIAITFQPGFAVRGRVRVSSSGLLSASLNDSARAAKDAGKVRHSWPLLMSYKGPRPGGRTADEYLDMPFFVAADPWTALQKHEYDLYTPAQRLGASSITQPWLWKSAETPTLRCRILLPTARRDGKVQLFEFKLRDDHTMPTLLRKTVVLLWMMDKLILTNAAEMMDSTPRSASPADRGAVLRHIDQLAASQRNGPFLIHNIRDGATQMRHMTWIFVPSCVDCQTWAASRQITPDAGRALSDVVWQRLIHEMRPGAGMAEPWSTYYDLFVSGV